MTFTCVSILPCHLSQIKRFPLYAQCLFGCSHKRTWCTKGSHAFIQHPDEKRPGYYVPVDQFFPGQLGLISQNSGYLTGKRIQCATVFMDDFSNFYYVHLMCKIDVDTTLEANRAF